MRLSGNRDRETPAGRICLAGVYVRLVNVAHGFDWQIYTLDDKVHPNEKGAALMAKTWFKAIKPFIKR